MGVLLAVVLLALGGRVWLGWLGRFLVTADPLRPVDALVVLGGGGRHRIEEGVRLALAGVAPWLVVTNTRVSWPGVRASYAELMAQEAQWQGVPPERIVPAPGLVTTTVEEALAVRALAAARGWRSLMVVTDPWHTRRARLIFRRILHPDGVAVCAHPAPKPGYETAAWWKTADGVRDTWAEYQKLALYGLGHR